MKTIIPFLILFLSAVLATSSEDSAYQNEPESSKQKIETAEEYSELYYIHGIQVSQRLCYAASCESDILESDTLKTSFLVRLIFSSENPDSVLFNGLEGANTTPREMFDGFNGGSAAYPDFICGPSLDCGHARKTGNDLEFEFSSPGGHYTGTGTLENDRLTILAQYRYRGAGADYFLEGQKIVEEK